MGLYLTCERNQPIKSQARTTVPRRPYFADTGERFNKVVQPMSTLFRYSICLNQRE